MRPIQIVDKYYSHNVAEFVAAGVRCSSLIKTITPTPCRCLQLETNKATRLRAASERSEMQCRASAHLHVWPVAATAAAAPIV